MSDSMLGPGATERDQTLAQFYKLEGKQMNKTKTFIRYYQGCYFI